MMKIERRLPWQDDAALTKGTFHGGTRWVGVKEQTLHH